MASPEAKAALLRNPDMASPVNQVDDETAVLQACITLPCTAAELIDAVTAAVGQNGDPARVSVTGTLGYDANHLRDQVAGVCITRNITDLIGNSEGLTPSDL